MYKNLARSIKTGAIVTLQGRCLTAARVLLAVGAVEHTNFERVVAVAVELHSGRDQPLGQPLQLDTPNLQTDVTRE
jgi:hypothetical protein